MWPTRFICNGVISGVLCILLVELFFPDIRLKLEMSMVETGACWLVCWLVPWLFYMAFYTFIFMPFEPVRAEGATHATARLDNKLLASKVSISDNGNWLVAELDPAECRTTPVLIPMHLVRGIDEEQVLLMPETFYAGTFLNEWDDFFYSKRDWLRAITWREEDDAQHAGLLKELQLRKQV